MWKKCSEKYEASTSGHIRNSRTKQVLHEFKGKDGYFRTQFDGKTRLVHRVIAKTFLENPDNLPEVNHINGHKCDNSLSNLEYCTRNENLRHAYSHKLRTAKGEKNANSKLSIDDVSYIKEKCIRRDKSFGVSALAKKYGVANQTISAVLSGQNWKEK